jgi:hypothetical protein
MIRNILITTSARVLCAVCVCHSDPAMKCVEREVAVDSSRALEECVKSNRLLTSACTTHTHIRSGKVRIECVCVCAEMTKKPSPVGERAKEREKSR